MSRIAFYAPIKPPDHPIASGDRLIAQNTIKALKLAGRDVELASSFIAYSKREDNSILQQRKTDALAEADRVILRLQANKPTLWLTYHPYCKAPDWIGPRVSRALQIPYVTMEAAKTGQGFENGGDRWAAWRAEAQAGLKQADLHLSFKPQDATYLRALIGKNAPVKMIAPFFDTNIPENLPEIDLPGHWRTDRPILITVAMMRPGKKTTNYQYLAKALTRLQHLNWNAIIIGGGPEFENIKAMFSSIKAERLLFTGALQHDQVLAHMVRSSLFVWPGYKEPIGMVYLEAQRMGLAVAAFDSMGVSLTVRHGKTGLLAEEGNVDMMSDNIRSLISHPPLLDDYATAAVENALQNHSLEAAAARFKETLRPILDAQKT